MNKNIKQKGFTLIELIAIILVLTAICLISFPTIINMAKQSKKMAYNEYEKNICLAAKTYLNNSNKILSDKTNYDILITDLIKEGYLRKNITDPETNTELNKENKIITVTKNDNNELSCSSVKYEEKSLIVTFYRNSNDADTTTIEQEFVTNKPNQKFIETNYTKTGYNIIGWSTNRNAKNAEYSLYNSVSDSWIYSNSPRINLYAIWNVNKYKIVFNNNGGTGVMSDQEFKYNTSQKLKKNTFTKKDYNFKGWSKTQNGDVEYQDEESVLNLTTENNGTITLYAQWSYDTYEVEFNPNADNVTGTMDNQQFIYSTPQSLNLNEYERVGYIFKGWNTSATGSGTHYDNGESVSKLAKNEKIILYAEWEPITYSVAYDGNGSTSGVTPSSTHTYDVLQKLTPNLYEKEGYSFKGWSKTKNGDVEYTDGQEVKNLTTTQSDIVILYAQWEEKTNVTYTVKFDSNGGTGTMNDQIFTSGISQKLTANQYKRVGYIFDNWNTKSDGKGTSYEDEKEVIDLTTNSEITLYAHWIPILYYVKYNANGGTGTMDGQTFLYDEEKNLLANEYKKEGYVFKGWSLTKDGDIKYQDEALVSNLTSEGEVTVNLYAKWEPITYRVMYQPNALDVSDNLYASKFTYDVEAKLLPNKYKRDGYVFKNWNTKKDGTGTSYQDEESVLNLTTISDAKVNLYAQWEATIANGTPIYFNVRTGRACRSQDYNIDNSKTGYNGVTGATTSGQNGCLKFYVFNDDGGDKINLILDHNTTATVAWNSGGTSKGVPAEIITQLKTDTDSWKGTITPDDYTVTQTNTSLSYTIKYNKARLITAQEVAQITGNTSWNAETATSSDSFYFDSKTSTASTTCTKGNTTGCKYGWLYDRAGGKTTSSDEGINCKDYGCYNNADKYTVGYWTSTAIAGGTTGAWRVAYAGSMYNGNLGTTSRGVRPVIEVSRDNIEIPEITSYSNGEAVYFDVLTGYKCTNYSSDNSKTGYNGITGATTANQNSCLKFYAFNDEGSETSSTVKLLLDHNISTADVTKSESNNNPFSSMSSWVGVNTKRSIEANEVAQITGASISLNWDSSNSPAYFYFDGSGDNWQTPNTSNNPYHWLYDRTQNCKSKGCLIEDSSTYGYWTKDALRTTDNQAWRMLWNGNLSLEPSTRTRGTRPVIEINRSRLNEVKNAVAFCKAVSTKTTGNIPAGKFASGDEYTCNLGDGKNNTFFVLENSGSNVSLIMKNNINSSGTSTTSSDPVYWCYGCHYESGNFYPTSSTTNPNGYVEAYTTLFNRTNKWTKVSQSQIKLPTLSQIKSIASAKCSDTTNTPTICSDVKWLYPTPLPTTTDNAWYGYWLGDMTGSGSNITAYTVEANYYAYDYMAYTTTISVNLENASSIERDIRPVITIPKTNTTLNASASLVSAQNVSALTGSILSLIS